MELSLTAIERMFGAASDMHRQTLALKIEEDVRNLQKLRDELVRLEVEKDKLGGSQLDEVFAFMRGSD